MAGTKGCEPATASQSRKPRLSSDCRLQPDGMKLESLVIVDQLRHGEYVPGPCTHRPSRHGSCERPKSVSEPGSDTDFGRSQLPWREGRCVQGPGTYSPWRS